MAALGVLAVPARSGAPQERGFCRADAVGAKGYVVERIAGRVYCLSAGGTMTAFVVGDSGVVFVDAPPALMELLASAVREVTRAPITHVVYSHSHLDHIGGANRMPAGVVRIAQEETARTLRLRNDPRRPAPTRTFGIADTLTVAGAPLMLRYHGPNHDLGQLLVYAPRERVLVGIDLFNGNAPWFRLGGARDVPGYLALHDSILGYEFDVFVGGHGVRTGTRQDLERQRAYLRDVVAAAERAAGEVKYEEAVAQMPATAHPLAKIGHWYEAQAKHCARQVLERWRGELPAVEVTTASHCDAMLESRRVD
jgi:glyoxylase-like metal-dependent hydrolase (beta-lactamase superfamily II)